MALVYNVMPLTDGTTYLVLYSTLYRCSIFVNKLHLPSPLNNLIVSPTWLASPASDDKREKLLNGDAKVASPLFRYLLRECT